MNDPVLLGAVAMFVVATGIGVQLMLPKLRSVGGPSKPSGPNALAGTRDTIVEAASNIIDKRSGRGLRDRLEKSGSQLRSGEWVLLVGAITLVMGALSYLIGELIAAVMVLIAVPIVANALLNRNITKRQEAFAGQLPDFLQNLSSSLRSGQSLPQSIASIAPDLEAPAGDELRRVVIENRIGRDLVESFRDLASRMESQDFDWVVRAIEINYRTGGDLSTILRRLDATIRARNQVAGTVRSLSAEGRISGLVLTALPPTLMLAVQFVNPGFLDPLFTTNIGRFLLIFSCIQLLVGSIWLSRMAKFKF